MRSLRRHLTAANVLATLALVVGAGGTSYAAVVYTGANVKDNTLTNVDFKRGALAAADLDAKTRASMAGAQGPEGAAGRPGTKGARGAKGPTGPAGAPANSRFSWSSWDAGYIDTTNPGLNAGLTDWHGWEYGNGCVAPSCHLEAANAGNVRSLSGAAAGATMIDLTATAPTGGNGGNGGPLTTIWQQSTLLAWANVTLLYRADDDASALHTRAECWMEIDGVRAGPSVQVSTGTQRELVTVFVVGNAVVAPGPHGAATVCRDADATAGRTRWQAVRANLSLMGNEKV